MSPEHDLSLQSRSDECPNSTRLSRRSALRVGLVVSVVPLAGCTSEEMNGTSPNNTTTNDEQNEDGNQSNDGEEVNKIDPDETFVAVIETYLQAAVEGDLDTMSEVSHSLNPLDPAAWVEGGWEFRGSDGDENVGEYNIELRTENGTVADLLELEGAKFWFERDELTAELDGEDIAVLEVHPEDPTEGEANVWVLATEDGEWKYLFSAPIDDTPDDPEEAFEEPIEDENSDVVEEIDWEYDSPTSDVPQAAVVLTDERGVDAGRIRAESTIAGASTEAYDRDDEDFTATWTGVTLYIQFNPDGDQIVVTAINEEDDKEWIIHREHYVPSEDSD
ncbi:hypothetical protein [Natronorubrum aibiense]|uniref:Uncharacterized protein n=1 Tax=Natronorubrum aibiense TaxID=348826 RepID=A0A5P9P8D3_9EURY|nr:hypothetical protein [Natronorubrum aibiense]QFU84382.1 hypothetical protein GCU68_17670 [Natronorubrum aibiense]